jgi:CshA-type fibril repeat protein
MADGVTAVTLNQVLTPIEAANLKFDPSGSYAGISTFTFTVTDNEGAVDATPATATITITNTPPVASDDNGFGVLGQPVTLNVLANDTDTENNLDPTSVEIVGANSPDGSLVVAGEGTWSVNLTTGAITFTPLPGFINDPTPISYTVKDLTGASSNAATVIVDYPPFKPVAVNDRETGTSGQPVLINVVANDVDPQSSLDPTTVKIVGTTNPGDALPVPGEGIWTVNPTTGAITFTPETGFTGDPTPISYTVVDNNTGAPSNPASITVDYPQTPPVANNDSANGISGQATTINVTGNDSDPENDLDPGSVKIAGTSNPGDSLVVLGQGTWSINPSTGAITFTPETGFTGDPTPISYTVKDRTGLSSNNATVSIDYPQTAPTAVNDSKFGVSGQAVSVDVVTNDSDPENDLDPTSVKIVGTLNPGDALFVADEGTWTVNPATGAITFTPLAGFTADPSPISYTVSDRTGLVSNAATVTVDYPQSAPIAVNDSVRGLNGQPATIDVVGNDSDPENDLDPTSVQIVGTSNPGDQLVVAGEGTWSVDPITGAITFTPEAGFIADPTPINYTVKDRTGLSSNPATVSVDYPPYAPVATNDSQSGQSGQPVTVDVLNNDSDPENDIDPTTVKIVGTTQPGESLVVINEGTWSVNASNGAITFTPNSGFTADPTAIRYTVNDSTGQTSNQATVTIDYPQTPPVAANDSQTGLMGQAVTIDVIANDSDPENDLAPGTVKIVGTNNPGDPLLVPNEGTWTINPSTGAITFTPITGFTADPTPISYTVEDRLGLISNPATVIVDYPQTAPLAVNDSQSGNTGHPITVDVIANDSDPDNDLDPKSVNIIGTAQPGADLVVTGEGTWSVNPTTGAITFTPEPGFTGDPTPIHYTVDDKTGLTSNQASVTLDYPQTAPTAINDSKTGNLGQAVVINVLNNDTDPENDLEPGSVQIVGTANPGESLSVAGQGTWSVNQTTGAITFRPIFGFTGDPTPISYTVMDRTGLISNPATVTVDYPDFIPIPPDNIWNAGNGSITPPKPIDPPKVDLGIVDKPHFYPILQMLDRLNNQPFGFDHLDLSAFKPYRDIDLPISREVDRIEHLRQFDDIFQRISSHGRSSWQLGGLRHSVTMQPKEVAADSQDFLSVHSKIVGNLLYVEFEHTVNQQAIYDIDHVHARLSDGRPLPEWLSFDQQNGLLSGIPPAGGEIIELQFSTTLQDGRVLSSAVEIEPDTGRLIKIEEPNQAMGHARFTDQVKQSADRFNVEKNALRSALKP